jgi:hypothetical protein
MCRLSSLDVEGFLRDYSEQDFRIEEDVPGFNGSQVVLRKWVRLACPQTKSLRTVWRHSFDCFPPHPPHSIGRTRCQQKGDAAVDGH